ncbi:MAG TPA: MBL fold metallo-hydrolase [Planctomycetota bacterium]|nr:MBL fold metallo-hydrolase [Planctomycetota bacterium]HRR81004.1 MBL fold metallo-hydrolase [Planctomycetota bacterium]HRT93638.1 MBL fold metallo-hydrolase [Planctomycetota bacterium]
MSNWLLGLAALVLLVPCVGMSAEAARLSIYWVDVEGGGATLIVTPAGESVLVDTGLDNPRDPGRIAKVARDVAGLKQIDHLVVTHFDIDHHGGAAELSKLIPIRRVYDQGGEIGRPEPMYVKYVAWRKTMPYTVLKPGDTLPLRQAEGAARASLTCLAAAQQFIAPGPDHKPNPIPASEAPEYPEDKSENRQSVVLLLRFGAFEFYGGADLTGRLEAKLVLPVNLVGEVDVYQVTHHGLDLSNNPVLVRSLAPTVTVMTNGDRKGCGPRTRAVLKATPSIQANYQLHKNLAPDADNTPDELIANLGPGSECKGNHIELQVAPDGAAYTVRIPATGHERTFRTK